MAGFTFRLEQEDGTPADAPTFRTVVPTWRAGDTIPLGTRTLRVIAIRQTTHTNLRHSLCRAPGT
jgi:hypothetical protein